MVNLLRHEIISLPLVRATEQQVKSIGTTMNFNDFSNQNNKRTATMVYLHLNKSMIHICCNATHVNICLKQRTWEV
jgi:hypothetical protein